PELLLRRRQAGRGDDGPHDEVVVDRGALRLAGREPVVDARFRAVRQERAQRTHLLRARLIEGETLAGVVDRGDDATLVTRDGRGDGGAGRLRHVGERLRLHGVLDAAEERLVLLLRAGARDDERILLRRVDEVLRRLPR